MNFKKIVIDSKGFTLIEVLASLTILGIILIGSMQFFSQAYGYTTLNQKKTAAINVARNALMFIENENFIEIRKSFEDNRDETFTILICDDTYEKFTEAQSPRPGCKPIMVNNIEYDVTVSHSDEQKSDYERRFIPITVRVEWAAGGNAKETEIEGVIKSEDIR
ncbi:prepilin-type cleavage/methylation domain-containing protein [Bacillus canaveralius]|uniref:Prepilin-type cleavage/methylation domain-containing protein n=1 Tax=Bacillus canaveralius TaxID=1403243 RepID=A0A2N5GQ35_9BACI|nr:type II secretion system protein [Bacillus canaveralius]PLR84988.1 prepilin-type cleavage/methylation domain-containing protein [Bacillus canaveralius]PLR93249.1 prepilin-type cleavage/methylation domain-containing protein [Bacillus canaveralius]RSK52449.1 type II secretion system protein [Bacillus canaveralius]